MKIDQIREKIADKLCSMEESENWMDILENTSPGNYGVEDVIIDVGINDIWVDIQHRSFNFKNVNISFSARLGGSSERNGYDQSFSKVVSGDGKFDFYNESKDITIIGFSINEDIDLY